MTRENMFVNPAREEWMTAELETALKALAKDGEITCAQAQKFARDNNIEMRKMKSFLDVAGLRVVICQLGLF